MIDSLALAGSHSQRTTHSRRLGVMWLHRRYIRTALAGFLFHALGVTEQKTHSRSMLSVPG
jgi:hypothetical protein